MRGGAPSAAHGSRGEYRGYPAVVRAEDAPEDVVEDLMRELGRMLGCCYARDVLGIDILAPHSCVGTLGTRVRPPPLPRGHRRAPRVDGDAR